MKSGTSEDDERIPMEVNIENQKLLKCELHIQQLLQTAEYNSQTTDEVKDIIQEARIEISSLRKQVDLFTSLTAEWTYDRYYESDIKPLINNHSKCLQVLQASLRKSFLGGEERLLARQKEDLLSDSNEGPLATSPANVRHRKIDKSKVADRASAITKNLLDIAKMMDAQVKSGEESNSVLLESSEMISETHEEFKGLTGIIANSRKLLNKYNRRELTDTLLIFFGLIFFCATVIFILWKRL